MKNYFNELKNESKNQISYIKRFIAYAIDWYVGGLLASIPLILLYMSLHEDASYIPQVITIFEQPYFITCNPTHSRGYFQVSLQKNLSTGRTCTRHSRKDWRTGRFLFNSSRWENNFGHPQFLASIKTCCKSNAMPFWLQERIWKMSLQRRLSRS